MRNPKTFSVTSMPVLVQLLAHPVRPAEHHHIQQQHEHQDAERHSEDAERRRLGGDRHEADDAHRVEQIGHGQRELRELHRVFPGGAMAVAGGWPEHHPHRQHEQDHATGDGQGSDREVQQHAQQLAQHHEHDGHRRRCGQHLALDPPLGRQVKGSRDFQERDQRELRPDTDQQDQEGVDRTGSGDRGLIHLPSVAGAQPSRPV